MTATCSACGLIGVGNFCGQCGVAREQVPMQVPVLAHVPFDRQLESTVTRQVVLRTPSVPATSVPATRAVPAVERALDAPAPRRVPAAVAPPVRRGPSGPVRPPAEARWVGQATVLGDMTITRLGNGLCYVIAGIACLFLAGQPGGGALGAVCAGLLLMAYGVKILITRTSYWVNSLTYLLAFGAVAYAISKL